MAGFNYKQRLNGLRSKHKLIGVYGMSSSGVTEFTKVAWGRGLTLMGDSHNLPVVPITLELLKALKMTNEQALELSPTDIADAIAANYDAYKIVIDSIFEDRMNAISDRIRNLEHDSGLTDPIFIECSLTTTVKYDDLFDAVIRITRPESYGDSWWVDHTLREAREFKPSDDTSVGMLKNSDRLFRENKTTPTIAIHNDGDLEQFQQACGEVIDQLL